MRELDLTACLNRSRSFANPDAFDTLVSSSGIDEFASARCDVRKRFRWTHFRRDLAQSSPSSSPPGVDDVPETLTAASEKDELDAHVSILAAEVATPDSSLTEDKDDLDEDWFYDTLRDEQNRRFADSRVAKGVSYARAGRNDDAARCYEQAITFT
jgi:hypothetical protein